MSTLYRVRKNFVYRIEAIDPTYSRISARFRCVDRLRLSGEREEKDEFGNNAGRAREFTVVRQGGGPELQPTHNTHRHREHTYSVRVAYPSAIGLEADVHEMMARDMDDILEALRRSDNNIGVTGDATAATGIDHRWLEGDELDDSGPVWVQTYEFSVRAREVIS